MTNLGKPFPVFLPCRTSESLKCANLHVISNEIIEKFNGQEVYEHAV